MKNLFILMLVLTTGCSGCRTDLHLPSWSNATPEQRASDMFEPDEPYYNSPQYERDLSNSVDVIVRIQKQRGEE